MNFLRRWVLHNWALKLLALAGSFLLWASYTAEPLSEAGYNAPIVFRNLPKGLQISGGEISQAHVVLRGRMQLLRRVQPADLAVSVDLSTATEGDNVMPLTPTHLDAPPGAQIMRISPAEIHVRLVRD